MRKRFLFCCLLLSVPGLLSGVTSTNQKSVVHSYRKLTGLPVRSAGYRKWFNAAGKAALNKDYGYAVLYWERARVVYDGDGVCTDNIQSVKTRTGANRFSVQIPFLVKFFLFFYFAFSRAVLYVIIVTGLVLFLILLNIGISLRRTAMLWFKITSSVLLVIVVLSAVSLALRTGKAADRTRAIIVTRNAPLRQHKAYDSTLLLKLPAGLEVSIASTEDDSYRISLPGGGQGWIPGKAAVRINADMK